MIPKGSFAKEEKIRLWNRQNSASYGLKEYYPKVTRETRTKNKAISIAAVHAHVPKTTRNRILGTITFVRAPLKLPPLMPRHRKLSFQWFRYYRTLAINCVLFTDETNATLEGPDHCANVWVYFEDESHNVSNINNRMEVS